jgi:hypothetical protein
MDKTDVTWNILSSILHDSYDSMSPELSPDSLWADILRRFREWAFRSRGEVTADMLHVERFPIRVTIDLDGSILWIEVVNNVRTMIEGMFRSIVACGCSHCSVTPGRVRYRTWCLLSMAPPREVLQRVEVVRFQCGQASQRRLSAE